MWRRPKPGIDIHDNRDSGTFGGPVYRRQELWKSHQADVWHGKLGVGHCGTREKYGLKTSLLSQ
jgi:hypothetical protein